MALPPPFNLSSHKGPSHVTPCLCAVSQPLPHTPVPLTTHPSSPPCPFLHAVTSDPPIQSPQTLSYSHPRPSHTVTPDPPIQSSQTLPCIQSPQTIPYNHPRPFHTFILDPPIQSPQTLPYSHSRIHDPRASHTVAQTIPYIQSPQTLS